MLRKSSGCEMAASGEPAVTLLYDPGGLGATIPADLLWAMGEAGVAEWADGSNPRIEWYLQSTPRGRWSHTDAVSWCGGFHCRAKLETGFSVELDHPHRAREWLKYGRRVALQEAELGDTAVLRLRKRGRAARSRTGSARGGYHVGWFLSRSRGGVVAWSGNVSDRVGADWYSPRVWEVVQIRKAPEL